MTETFVPSEVRAMQAKAWEEGRAAAQTMWVTVTSWGGKVPDGVVEQLNPYLQREVDPTPEHHPVGAYLPIGQLDGDCYCGQGEWPHETVYNKPSS